MKSRTSFETGTEGTSQFVANETHYTRAPRGRDTTPSKHHCTIDSGLREMIAE